MLRLGILFLVIAFVAGLFAFGGAIPTEGNLARILFFVFVVLTVAAFAANFFRKQTPRDLA